MEHLRLRGDIVESRVWVKEGKRRRILPLEVNSEPHDGAIKDTPPMRQSKTKTMRSPAVTVDSMGLGQIEQTSGWESSVPTASPLDAIARAGAREMLQKALESEVQEFLDRHSDRVDAQGRRLVVRNGHLPPRELLTGVGPLELRQPRVRDKSPDPAGRVRFSSQILPPYLRKTKAIEELIPWLYLKGISSGDFSEALPALVGPSAAGLSRQCRRAAVSAIPHHS